MAGHDCDRLLEELDDLLHGEVTPERKAALDAHLQSCPPCFERADFQAQLRHLVAGRCTESVPEALRLKVRSVLEIELRTSDSAARDTSP